MNRSLESYEEVARVLKLYLDQYNDNTKLSYFDDLANLARCANRVIEEFDLKLAQSNDIIKDQVLELQKKDTRINSLKDELKYCSEKNLKQEKQIKELKYELNMAFNLDNEH